MIAKISFTLSGDSHYGGKLYRFNTTLNDLQKGDLVLVDSRGKETIGFFVGYELREFNDVTKDIIRKLNEDEIEKFWEDIKQRLILKPLKIKEKALPNYRFNFKGNHSENAQTASIKLTRNVLLSSNFKNPKIKSKCLVFKYGYQDIYVKGNLIQKVEQNFENEPLNISEQEKQELHETMLNVSYGIVDDTKGNNKKDYTITPPNKDDLTSRGFTRYIKINSDVTVKELMDYGFTNAVESRLYFCKMLNNDISFNLTANKQTFEILNIDVLDEDFGQPYDYQSMIMKDGDNALPFAKGVFNAVDRLLKKMQNDGIITGYKRGMYV